MGAIERSVALGRTRERQARIRVATARAAAAQRRVRRAVEAKEQAVERCDERIVMAKEILEVATADLAVVCRSADVAAEILGLSKRQVRRAMKSQRERRSLAGQTAPEVEGPRDAEAM